MLTTNTMKEIFPLLCAILSLFVLLACDEGKPDFVSGNESFIVYSQDGKEDAIAAAWRPSALLVRKNGDIVYADQAMRKLRVFEPSGAGAGTLADLASFESSLGSDVYWDANWGLFLKEIGADLVILAGKNRRPIVVHLQTGSVTLLGAAPGAGVQPQEGVQIQALDFSELSGMGFELGALFLVFPDGLYRVQIPNGGVQALGSATLTKLAGRAEGAHYAYGSALHYQFDLPAWTDVIAFNNGVILGERRALSYIKDGEVFRFLGEGSKVGSGIEIADFAGRYMSQYIHMAKFGNTLFLPHGARHQSLLAIHLDELQAISPDELQVNPPIVRGTVVEEIFPNNIAGLDLDGLGNIVYSTSLAGNISRFDPKTLNHTVLFGPKSPQDRKEVGPETANNPYRLNALLGPQSLALLYNGSAMMVHEPLLSRVSFMVEQADKSWSLSPMWKLEDRAIISHLVSDSDRLVYAIQGRKLYRLFFGDEETASSLAMDLFSRSYDYMGAPNLAHLIDLPRYEGIGLFSAYDGFLLRFFERSRLLSWNLSNSMVDLENDPQYGSCFPNAAENSSCLCTTLDLERVYALHAYKRLRLVTGKDRDDKFLILIANIADDEASFLGQSLPTRQYKILAGAGSQDVAPNIALQDTMFHEQPILSLSSQGLWLAVQEPEENTSLWAANESHQWVPHASGCGALPQGIVNKLFVDPTSNATFVQIDFSLFACAPSTVFYGNTGLKPSWTLVETEIFNLNSIIFEQNSLNFPDASSAIAFVKNRTIYLVPVSTKSKAHSLFAVDSSVQSLALGIKKDLLYVAFKHDGVIEPVQLWEPTQNQAQEAIGEGIGLPMQSTLRDFTPGYTPLGIALDSHKNIYLHMRDNAAIWRISANEDGNISPDSQVILLAKDKRLNQAEYHIAISPHNELALAGDNGIYFLHTDRYNDLKKQPEILNEYFEHVRAVSYLGDDLIVWSRTGLYIVSNVFEGSYELGEIPSIYDGPVFNVSGLIFDLGAKYTTQQSMVSLPQQRAVRITSPWLNAILQIPVP